MRSSQEIPQESRQGAGGLRRDFTGVRITTPRLLLRPLGPADADRLFEIHSDPEFMRYWSSPPWTSPDRALQMVAEDERGLPAGEHLRLGIERRSDGLLVGNCVLFKLDDQNRRAELGYGIARDCWRQGYMHEAVRALLEHGFGTLGLHRVEADIDPRNLASARALEKLGFIREGLLRERWFVAGEVSDSALYGLLAEEFARRDGFHPSPGGPDTQPPRRWQVQAPGSAAGDHVTRSTLRRPRR